MSTTAISTDVKTIDYPALRPESRQIRIIEANLDGEPMREQDLIRVRTPLGGATQWSVDINGNLVSCDEITGLLVGIAKRGVLWPSDDPTEQRPVVVTNDLLVGYRVSDDLARSIRQFWNGFVLGTVVSTGPRWRPRRGRSGSGVLAVVLASGSRSPASWRSSARAMCGRCS